VAHYFFGLSSSNSRVISWSSSISSASASTTVSTVCLYYDEQWHVFIGLNAKCLLVFFFGPLVSDLEILSADSNTRFPETVHQEPNCLPLTDGRTNLTRQQSFRSIFANASEVLSSSIGRISQRTQAGNIGFCGNDDVTQSLTKCVCKLEDYSCAFFRLVALIFLGFGQSWEWLPPTARRRL
jgi:hypothetical protein